MLELEKFQESKNSFTFVGFEKDPDLERKANLKLIQLLAFAPPGAVAYGKVEITDNTYLACVEVGSSFRKFTAKAIGTSAEKAINRVLLKIEDQIYQWRFGGSAPTPSGFGHARTGNSPSLRSGYSS